ncbi:UNVERIFIED_CONTAM: hypothetical protein HDU68_002520 [Siphonaria sp. JEL0065]|nr:hypothetical protein HDU68_002520 [Siphonaria sp. JEL0065]
MARERTPLLAQTRTQRRHWIWTRLRYYVPVLTWLPVYPLSQFPSDALAGLSVACLLVPQGLSYAQAILHIPPVYGLYTCITPLLVYSLLGTSKQLGVGPEALVSILTAAAIRESTLDINESIAVAGLLALLVGMFTFILGFFRLGFLDSVLSRALLRGFVTAVALVVIIDQSENLLGLTNLDPFPPPANITSFPHETFLQQPPSDHEKKSPIETLFEILENLYRSHVPTTLVSLFSIAFLVATKILKGRYKDARVLQVIPEILVLVVVSTVVSWAFRLDLLGVGVMKDVEGGLRAPQWPVITLPRVRYYILSAILIAVIGFVESIVIGKTYASKYNYSVSPNRELVALGVANIVGSFFGGWPAFGSLGRSAVNDAAGGRSQISGFITCVVVLITTVYLLPLFYFLPKAVCSSIIVVAATKLIELHDIRFILQVRAWNDFGLLLLTFFTTLFVSIEVGTLISVGTSLLLVIKHTTKTRIAILGRTLIPDPTTGAFKPKFRPLSEKINSDTATAIERIDGCLILRIEEGLFFGNSGQLKDRLKRIELFGDLSVHPGEAPTRRGGARSPSRLTEGSVSLFSGNSSLRLPTERSRSRSADSQRPGSRSPSTSPRNEQHRYESEDLDEFDELLEEEDNVVVGSPTEVNGPDLVTVIFDVGAVTAIDASATQTLVEIVESYHSRNVIVSFVKLRDSCKPWFNRSGLTSLVTPSHFYQKVGDAVDAHYRLVASLQIESGSSHMPISVPSTPTLRRGLQHQGSNLISSNSGSYQSSQPLGPPLRFAGDLEFGYEEEEEIAFVHPRNAMAQQAVQPVQLPPPPPPPVGSWGADDVRGGFTGGVAVNGTASTQLGRPSFVNGLTDGFHSGFSSDGGSLGAGSRIPGQLRGAPVHHSHHSALTGTSPSFAHITDARRSKSGSQQQQLPQKSGSQFFSTESDLDYGSDNVWD